LRDEDIELVECIRPAKHTVDVGVCLGIDYRVLRAA
jgi:hypothetical protein